MNRLLFNIPEVIETQRLFLHMPKVGYGEELYEAIIDGYEDYVKWLNWSPQLPTAEMVEEECCKHHAEFILRDPIRYIVLDKTTHTVIGRCAFPPIQAHWFIPQFGISYFIRKTQRSKGYATEATHAMALLAFKILKAKKVEIYCDVDNKASSKVPLKLNFKLEYTQKGGWLRASDELATLETYSLFSVDQLLNLEVKW